MAVIAEARPTPPNMKLFPTGPTHRASLSGRYQRCGLWVAFRSKNGLVMRWSRRSGSPLWLSLFRGRIDTGKQQESDAVTNLSFGGSALGLPRDAFTKADPGDDAALYAEPRLVTYIDDRAIAALTDFYRQALPPGSVVLDLMSSWVSHLPPEVAYAQAIGHGMNAVELAANPRFTRWFTQDLNREPKLPLDDA